MLKFGQLTGIVITILAVFLGIMFIITEVAK